MDRRNQPDMLYQLAKDGAFKNVNYQYEPQQTVSTEETTNSIAPAAPQISNMNQNGLGPAITRPGIHLPILPPPQLSYPQYVEMLNLSTSQRITQGPYIDPAVIAYGQSATSQHHRDMIQQAVAEREEKIKLRDEVVRLRKENMIISNEAQAFKKLYEELKESVMPGKNNGENEEAPSVRSNSDDNH